MRPPASPPSTRRPATRCSCHVHAAALPAVRGVVVSARHLVAAAQGRSMTTAEDEEIVKKRLAASTIQLRGDYPFRTIAKLCGYSQSCAETAGSSISRTCAARDLQAVGGG